MVEVILRERKPPVLTPSSLPCLRHVPTINVTQGCALGCAYCYIQGYSGYPGSRWVIVYGNLPEAVAAELRRRRRKARRVYFSPSSDAFQYLPEVQDVSLRTMRVLLEAGVEVAFLTKGFVKRPFMELFAYYADLVFGQIGITTLSRPLWRALEPRTAPPQVRIKAIETLRSLGVSTTARLDPLIPDLTDTDENTLPLLRMLARSGIRDVAASYLFTRPAFERHLLAALGDWYGPGTPLQRWSGHQFAEDAGSGKMISLRERARRFGRLEALGNSVGIRVRPCRCKNPELADSPCGITGPDEAPRTRGATGQRTFTFFG